MTKLNWMTKACGVFLLWAAAATALPAQTLVTLHSFDLTDGGNPYAGLVQGADGTFYGTTTTGGANTSASCGQNGFIDGCGTVFKITTSGVLTTIYNFCSRSDCADGANPLAGLVLATDGNFYGTTEYGGTSKGCCGTVFRITPSGTLRTLHRFDETDGLEPTAGLVQGTDGNFYGTTTDQTASGTIFKITPGGTLTTLYTFCSQGNCIDGAYTYAGLAQGTDGNFYGTTVDGGANNVCGLDDNGSCGTVFKVTPSGTLTTLHSFDRTDGANPYAGLVQGTDGDFYGTTVGGGTNDNCGDFGCGTVFKITPSGTLTTLYSFCSQSNCTDGSFPGATLAQGTDGNFYGTTEEGGANETECDGFSCGTVFRITPSGTLTTLLSFGGANGGDPMAGLVQGTNGFFYGTTREGGANDSCSSEDFQGCGTVFSLNVGLGQFVETLPTSAKVGAHITILGSFLTGATSVTFNGTAATFTIISKSEILTTVPTGATTGTVQVISPRLGTLSSNVPFTVRP